MPLSLRPHVSSWKRYIRQPNDLYSHTRPRVLFDSSSLLLWGTSGREPWERVCGATYHTNASILSLKVITLKFCKKLFWMKLQFWNFPFSFLFLQDSTFAAFISERYVEHRVHREERSLRHVAMVSKCLNDKKPIKSLKSLFALFQTPPILFNFI